MNLNSCTAQIVVPDGKSITEALKRINHLGIGAHQDDLEFMAFHGILECFYCEERWFGGVICTNGSGSPRTGKYANFTDAQMVAVRQSEQNNAALVGQYGVMIQLDYPSSEINSPTASSLKHDLKEILFATKPKIVYTHNPADKHDTHIGVVIAALLAMRELPPEARPRSVIGCEVWRNLDWLSDTDKVLMDVSGHDNLARALNGMYDSQIAGGKLYDLATLGRRAANATFFESHATDKSNQLIFGMDLTPLVLDESIDIVEFVSDHIERFLVDVKSRLRKLLGSN